MTTTQQVQALLLTRHAVSQTSATVHAARAETQGTSLPLASSSSQWVLFADIRPIDKEASTRIMPLALPSGLEPPAAHYFATPCLLIQWANRAKERAKPTTTIHAYKRALICTAPASTDPPTPAPSRQPEEEPQPLSDDSEDEYDDASQHESDTEE